MKKRNPDADELLHAIADLRKNTALLVQEQKNLIEFCRANRINLKQYGYKGSLPAMTAPESMSKTNIFGKFRHRIGALFFHFTAKRGN